MKEFERANLDAQQHQALTDLKHRLLERFNIEALILYGSAARSEADDESDIDLLVVTRDSLSRYQRHEITDVVFEINLSYGTNFSTLVVDSESWERGLFSVLPLKDEVLADGILL
jgi:predicted nucleotidyltransferase